MHRSIIFLARANFRDFKFQGRYLHAFPQIWNKISAIFNFSGTINTKRLLIWYIWLKHVP
jgi:hypothetical protein